MKTIACDQYSPEWWTARRGIPTASEFGSILTAKTMKLAAASETYICRLIGDTFDLGYGQNESYCSPAMHKGLANEPESRRYYQMVASKDVQQVGFCLTDDDRFGCSPDGLVGDDGVLELKNPSAHTHVGWLLAGGLPDEHRAQVHGELIVTGRAWADFLSYAPGLPPLLVRVTPDKYTEALSAALETFWTRYQELLGRIREAA